MPEMGNVRNSIGIEILESGSGIQLAQSEIASFSPGTESGDQLVIEVGTPGADAVRTIDVSPGANLSIDFQLSLIDGGATAEFLQNGDLWLITRGQGTVILKGFADAVDGGGLVSVAGADPIALSDFLAQVALAYQPGGSETPVEDPNAGHDSGTFSTFEPGELGPGLVAIGGLGNTDLFFGLDVQDERILGADEEIVPPLPNPPDAIDDTYSTSENTTLSEGSATGVLTNDTDIDGDLISVTAFQATSGEGGTVSVAGDGSFTYTPSADFNGTDSFTYTITDSGGLTDSATVTVTVGEVNDPPVVPTNMNVFMPDDTAQMTGIYVNGYPLEIEGPTDIDSALTITVTVVPAVGSVYLADGVTVVSVGDELTTAELEGLLYMPDGVVEADGTNDPIDDEVMFQYDVFDGTTTIGGTVNITTLVANPDNTIREESPFNSGNSPKNLVLPITQQIVDDIGATGIGSATYRTNFQEKPIPNPNGEVNDGTDIPTTLTILQDEVFITLEITDLDTGTTATFTGPLDWQLVEGFWVVVVNFDEFVLESDGMTTLKAFLIADPPEVGDIWTTVFVDTSGGNYQGSFVEAQYDFGVTDAPDYSFTGTAQDDLIYGSTLDDRLDGQGGDDVLIGREGMDTYIGGDGADTFDLTETTAASDTIDYTNVTEFGDTVTGFDVNAPASGGDQIDLADVLVGFTGSVADAVTGGFIRFTESTPSSGVFDQVEVDATGSSDGASWVTVLTFSDLSYASALAAQSGLEDNIIV